MRAAGLLLPLLLLGECRPSASRAFSPASSIPRLLAALRFSRYYWRVWRSSGRGTRGAHPPPECGFSAALIGGRGASSAPRQRNLEPQCCSVLRRDEPPALPSRIPLPKPPLGGSGSGELLTPLLGSRRAGGVFGLSVAGLFLQRSRCCTRGT
ncbi:unnamed protein product [Coccothraustes coccothraustes]